MHTNFTPLYDTVRTEFMLAVIWNSNLLIFKYIQTDGARICVFLTCWILYQFGGEQKKTLNTSIYFLIIVSILILVYIEI